MFQNANSIFGGGMNNNSVNQNTQNNQNSNPMHNNFQTTMNHPKNFNQPWNNKNFSRQGNNNEGMIQQSSNHKKNFSHQLNNQHFSEPSQIIGNRNNNFNNNSFYNLKPKHNFRNFSSNLSGLIENNSVVGVEVANNFYGNNYQRKNRSISPNNNPNNLDIEIDEYDSNMNNTQARNKNWGSNANNNVMNIFHPQDKKKIPPLINSNIISKTSLIL